MPRCYIEPSCQAHVEFLNLPMAHGYMWVSYMACATCQVVTSVKKVLSVSTITPCDEGQLEISRIQCPSTGTMVLASLPCLIALGVPLPKLALKALGHLHAASRNGSMTLLVIRRRGDGLSVEEEVTIGAIGLPCIQIMQA